ncbi:MAG: hypothetical protein ACLQSR_16755, partial [Limisphaerales bacterium]
AGAGNQSLCQVVVDAPVALTVGIGQRAVGHGGTEPQPIRASSFPEFFSHYGLGISHSKLSFSVSG